MTDPASDEEVDTFPSEIIMIDSDGKQTDDPARAVSGEVVETLPDGSKRSTLFTAG